MLKRRQAAERGSSPSQTHYDAGSWLKSTPTLVEFLTQELWEGGDRRIAGTVTLMAEDGVWKCCLRDRDAGCYAFLSGKTPTDLLLNAEKALASDAVDWRVDRPQGSRGKARG